MLIKKLSSRTRFLQIFTCFALSLSGPAHAQSATLLEACNAVEDRDKRLVCFKELATLNSPITSTTVAASNRVKSAFAAVAGAVKSGISLNNYSLLVLEPSKELEIFRQGKPTPNQRALDLYGEALQAYRDAEKVWHANIFKSSDAGMFFGKILNPQMTGLQGIVNKYNLPTREVLLNKHLDANIALELIWSYARERTKAANDEIESPASSDATQNSSSNFQALVALPIDPLKFQWPANGAVLKQFSEENVGLVIDGILGEPVVAARGGVVVFSSNRLKGYGNLIIIKHDNTFLTAYAHNSELMVAEGDVVTQGQLVAKMGATETDSVKLHFEIRKNGKPVDPLQYLPSNKQ